MKLVITIMMMVAAVAVFAAPDGNAADKTAATSSAMADARSKITKIIANPKLMAKVIKNLSQDEQLMFIGEVNQAIATLSASEEEKAAVFLNVNRAAIDGAAETKSDLALVVAEIYATVSVSALPVIHESFAQNVFNRASNPKVTYTDEQYAGMARSVMGKIVARLATASDPEVRSGFAALMLIKASNNATPVIVDAVVSTLPESVQGVAKDEWIPAGTAVGEARNYDSLMAMSQNNIVSAEVTATLRIAGPQMTGVLLTDLAGFHQNIGLTTPVTDAVIAPTRYDLPRLGIGDGASDDAAAQIGAVKQKIENGELTPVPTPEPEPEPGPYQWQRTK